jgi:predicted nucleic acid-binding protein
MLIAACREAGVDRLYSEDLPGREVSGLVVENPFVGL